MRMKCTKGHVFYGTVLCALWHLTLCSALLRIEKPTDFGSLQFPTPAFMSCIESSFQLRGNLTRELSGYGCQQYRYFVLDQLVIVTLGKCSIETKALFARQAGAAGLLVVEDQQGPPGYYYNTEDGINYNQFADFPPVVLVAAQDGVIMNSLVTQYSYVVATLLSGDENTWLDMDRSGAIPLQNILILAFSLALTTFIIVRLIRYTQYKGCRWSISQMTYYILIGDSLLMWTTLLFETLHIYVRHIAFVLLTFFSSFPPNTLTVALGFLALHWYIL
jgi:hypothetical protein